MLAARKLLILRTATTARKAIIAGSIVRLLYETVFHMGRLNAFPMVSAKATLLSRPILGKVQRSGVDGRKARTATLTSLDFIPTRPEPRWLSGARHRLDNTFQTAWAVKVELGVGLP